MRSEEPKVSGPLSEKSLVCPSNCKTLQLSKKRKKRIRHLQTDSTHWIRLLEASDTLDKKMYTSFHQDLDEILRILIAGTKTIKESSNEK